MISVFERGAPGVVGPLLLALGLWAPQARAGNDSVESDARMAARALATQGTEAFEAHEFPRALALFERASAIIRAPTITLMQARTLLELGRLVEAAEQYEETRRLLAAEPDNAAFRAAADAAERELPPLTERIPTLRVRVAGIGPSEQPEIQIDGKKVPPELAAVDHPVDPGPHRLEVRTQNGSAVRDVTLAERQHQDIELSLGGAASGDNGLAAPASAPAPRDTSGGTQRVVGWALIGTGAAFVGMGAVTGILALHHKSHLDDVCGAECPPDSGDEIDTFRLQRTLSYVGFGVGALAVAGGVVVLFTAPTGGQVALEIGPGAVLAAGTF